MFVIKIIYSDSVKWAPHLKKMVKRLQLEPSYHTILSSIRDQGEYLSTPFETYAEAYKAVSKTNFLLDPVLILCDYQLDKVRLEKGNKTAMLVQTSEIVRVHKKMVSFLGSEHSLNPSEENREMYWWAFQKHAHLRFLNREPPCLNF